MAAMMPGVTTDTNQCSVSSGQKFPVEAPRVGVTWETPRKFSRLEDMVGAMFPGLEIQETPVEAPVLVETNEAGEYPHLDADAFNNLFSAG